MRSVRLRSVGSFILTSLLFCPAYESQQTTTSLTIDWNVVDRVSKTSISIQDCPEPPLLRKAPTHDAIYKALRDLKADYARLQPWHPYPRISVAELEPPQNGRTFWDFTLMDEVAEDFMAAAEGRPVVFDIGTIPEWMFKTPAPVTFPTNPEEIFWNYEQGTVLRDPTLEEVADYQARLASWYIQGGFNDENGKWHPSGHHFKIAYWEVLNEVDGEHELSPELYTRIYDAIVEKVRKVAPDMKFIGLALADPMNGPDYFTYFLDREHHKAGIPIDMISYHFYSQKDRDLPIEDMQYTLFEEADKFLTAVRYIDSIRRRFHPDTKVYIDELGSMLPDPQAPQLAEPIPDFYWNAAGAMWGYVFGHLEQQHIDIVGGAELIDYPGQFASTSLLYWDTGKPNARYRVLKLLHDNCRPGDKLVKTSGSGPFFAQAFITAEGKRKILFVNERARQRHITVPGASGGSVQSVDLTTTSAPPSSRSLQSDAVDLQGLAVAIVTLR